MNKAATVVDHPSAYVDLISRGFRRSWRRRRQRVSGCDSIRGCVVTWFSGLRESYWCDDYAKCKKWKQLRLLHDGGYIPLASLTQSNAGNWTMYLNESCRNLNQVFYPDDMRFLWTSLLCSVSAFCCEKAWLGFSVTEPRIQTILGVNTVTMCTDLAIYSRTTRLSYQLLSVVLQLCLNIFSARLFIFSRSKAPGASYFIGRDVQNGPNFILDLPCKEEKSLQNELPCTDHCEQRVFYFDSNLKMNTKFVSSKWLLQNVLYWPQS